ncbi:MAG: DUF1365 family protein [Pedobacter sp.]|nr:MAG: DUF1365 family protein [Pedobacter sp.]
MPFESCIYTAKVMHHRLAPKKHSFWYNVYMFYIDLDEIDLLEKKLRWFSRNKFNLFSLMKIQFVVWLKLAILTAK